jgi:hypothetical protein
MISSVCACAVRRFHVLKAFKENLLPQLPALERDETYADLVLLMESPSEDAFDSRLDLFKAKVSPCRLCSVQAVDVRWH